MVQQDKPETRAAPAVSVGPTSVTEWTKTGLLKDWIAPRMRTYAPFLDLPNDMLAEIGRIVTHWAYAEWMLTDIYNKLSGWDRKGGRQVEKYPPINTVRDKIKVLLPKRGIQVSEDQWRDFAQRITACDVARNLLSHGPWFKDDDGKIGVQDIAGTWGQGEKGKETDPVSRREYPGSTYPDAKWFSDRMADIKAITALIEDLWKRVP